MRLGMADETRKLNGRYRLLNPLGAGSVRLAFDEAEHRDVAVRRLRVPPELREAALQEARRATALRHAFVVRVLDVLVEDGEPWLVMEFVSGASLEQTVRSRRPLPVPQAARIGVCVLSALTAAHAAGIVHGRVDPGNVLLTTTGRAVLTGFGFPSLSMLPSADLWALAATLHFAVEGSTAGPGAHRGRRPVQVAGQGDAPAGEELVGKSGAAMRRGGARDAGAAGGGPAAGHRRQGVGPAAHAAQVAAIGLAVLDRLADWGGFHGGVQPGNVLIDVWGRARLTPLPGPGTLPAYTAPEGAATQAADLWSLGATLFTAVEGGPPAPGAPLRRAGPLAPVLFQLLSGNPLERPTLDELRRDLLRIASGSA